MRSGGKRWSGKVTSPPPPLAIHTHTHRLAYHHRHTDTHAHTHGHTHSLNPYPLPPPAPNCKLGVKVGVRLYVLWSGAKHLCRLSSCLFVASLCVV